MVFLKRWILLLSCVLTFLAGRELNRWQVRIHGVMPFSFPWGDWIPYKDYLFSIGDVMQFVAWLALFVVAAYLWGKRGQTWK